MRKSTIVYIFLTLFIIFGSLVGGYFAIEHYTNYTVQANSVLGQYNDKSEVGRSKTLSLKKIIHNSQKAVVQVETSTTEGKVIGSGFLFNDKGDVITNAHVVGKSNTVYIKTADASKYEGTVIGKGEQTDIAVIRVPGLAGQSHLSLQSDSKVEISDDVIALGSPLGFQNTVTTGIISGVGRNFDLEGYQYKNVYQISAPIAHGNSGGPLLNRKNGKVIGINSAGVKKGNMGFSIPINNVINKVSNWSKHPKRKVTANAEPLPIGEQALQLSKQQSKYIVNYFYDSISLGDFVSAYSLLGSEWQKKTAYKDFRSGYIKTVDVKVLSISATRNNDVMTVKTLIEATKRNNGRKKTKQKYNATYTIGIENDQLKILEGSATKANQNSDKADQDKKKEE
ncbi:S1C family serine protease [Tuberibacillus sp. Marseille-P3662]|uniref:S1C family serine protease n=1 Tax=Tuberibacillus sp. Marseille-P3662 TaxID=1965358 RepID=UPI000A1C9EF4|nr:trypsin-like peptidase domain-containing protein [Tuberibacillus sp. Marseille-P3662]